TYRVENLSDETILWRHLDQSVRNVIRKAERNSVVVTDSDGELESFIKLNEQVFARQGLKIPYSANLIRRLDAAAEQQGSRKLLLARSARGEPLAGVFLVWDEHTVYYLMGGSSSEQRGSGANTLCLWEAIRFAARTKRNFDFEGSMIEGIEHF